MKKACFVISAPFDKGAIFDRNNSDLNRDNCLQFYYDLQDILWKNNIDLNTYDINRQGECDFIIYNEMPRLLPQNDSIVKSFLLLFECEVIRPDNWEVSSHNRFSKIFTWHDSYIDEIKYFKLNFTHDGSIDNFLSFKEKSKFCTLIAGNKVVSRPLELYSHRKKAISWFENNHPDKFDFYGIGWDMLTFDESKLTGILNRFSFLKGMRKRLMTRYSSYRGKINSKIETLKDYKFSICYENAQEIPGYITEKIFDSMAAGCIPVYWGAPNISDYVPEDCYIDKRKFKTYEDLYNYLIGMSEDEYNSRLEHIRSFLHSAISEQFSPYYNARSVVKHILDK